MPEKPLIILDQPGGIFPEVMDYINTFAKIKIPETYDIDELIGILKEADAVMTWGNTKLTEEILFYASDKMKTIAVTGIGYDNVDVKAALAKGIIITNTPGANANAVAEYTVGMILTSIRNCFKGALMCANKDWVEADAFNGNELRTSTVGIIALGNIGRRVVALLSSFGCEIIGFDPNIETNKKEELIETYHIEIVDTLEEISKRANVITMHAPLMESTFHMLNIKHFQLMQPGTWVINVGRAPVVDEDALYEYLKDFRIGGYCTDVFPIEPPDYSRPIYSLDNVIATPHIAAMSYDAHREMQMKAAENIWAVLNNKKPINVIKS